jgi:hypothetical protein
VQKTNYIKYDAVILKLDATVNLTFWPFPGIDHHSTGTALSKVSIAVVPPDVGRAPSIWGSVSKASTNKELSP